MYFGIIVIHLLVETKNERKSKLFFCSRKQDNHEQQASQKAENCIVTFKER